LSSAARCSSKVAGRTDGLRGLAAPVFAFVAVVALAAPAVASAHIRTGIVAVDYRARVFRLPRPLLVAAAVRIAKTDQALGLTVRNGHDVVVLGYAGEAFLRINGAGVAVNESSPTAAATGLVKLTDSSSSVRRGWHLRPGQRTAIWHDARLRGLPPGVQHAEWMVPLVVDGSRVRIMGEIWRVHAPSPWPWFVLAVPFVVLTALLLARHRSLLRRAAVALGVVATAGTIATAAAFALAASASEGRWVEGANELVFALVGVAVLARGSADARPIAGGGLGLLGVSVGLSKVPVLLHGVVLSAFPAALTRVGSGCDCGWRCGDGRGIGRVLRAARLAGRKGGPGRELRRRAIRAVRCNPGAR
jgi:hypothetical protein